MADLTRDSDRIMSAAGNSLQVQRQGGRRVSIGKGSAELKTQHMVRKVKRIVMAIGAIVIAAMMAGLIIDGIGFAGVMVTFFAILAAIAAFTVFPKMKVPNRADLTKGDVAQMVGRTELWLEAQRPALPPPAITMVDQIGVQLDALGLQLKTIDQNHPAAREVRKLVGEHLPEMVDSYRKVPTQLRGETRAGATPDQQLTEGLGRISAEIDSVTRQLADGALDDLAIKHRYLDYKYGNAADGSAGMIPAMKPGIVPGRTPDTNKDTN
ncbi:hypothetical protein [Allopontixanthobacter confluentis]|uniref:hypothetical protein n=1 Tax=Allopontixanthobacter confluentis TaxID=1849021 RepID=UPI001E4B64B0|nr:hypothetical protein [Allopontixanthobacter confluentis]